MGFSKAYANKLLDGRWQRKRLEVLNRDGFMCTSCGRQHNVQVHHNWYLKNYEPWDYELNQLVTLCGDHHEEVGTVQEAIKRLLSTTGPDDQKKVYDFLMALKQEGKETKPAKTAEPKPNVLAVPPDGQYQVVAKKSWKSSACLCMQYVIISSGQNYGDYFQVDFWLWAGNESKAYEAKRLFSDLCRAADVFTPKDSFDLHEIPVFVHVTEGEVVAFLKRPNT